MKFRLPRIDKLINYVEKIELYTSMFLLIVLVLLITASVLLRYVFHIPAMWISSTITLIFIWISMLSVSYVYKKMGHISITYFVDMFSDKKIRVIINLFIYLVIFVSLLLVMLGTIKIIPIHSGRFIIGLGISRVYLSTAILIATISMLITTLHFIFLQVKKHV